MFQGASVGGDYAFMTNNAQQELKKVKKEEKFKTKWYHRKPAHWLKKSLEREPGFRNEPEVFRLEVEAGVRASEKPPVRIFLGTVPSQYRSERVFIWSVKQVRDPARVYEIYIMKDLKGYDRSGWKTGFTNYRYAIPAMAGGSGRAIYNDVDQLYLADPAELFDIDMQGAGFLGVTGRDTSVMLIDCDIMIRHWTKEDAQNGKKHRHFLNLAHDNARWGQLPGEWNARDDEYDADKSKCFHFTTLHTQPWRPFPKYLRYQEHPDGEVWFSRERSADASRFTVFTKEQPSAQFKAMLEQYRIMHEEGEKVLGLSADETFDGHSLAKHDEKIATLIKETSARTILDYGCGKGALYRTIEGEAGGSRIRSYPKWPNVKITCFDPGHEPFAAPVEGRFDGVISTDVVEHIPEGDIGWVLDEIFSFAERFVYIVAACYPARKTLPDGTNAHCTIQSPEWWQGQLQLAAQRYPGVSWTLCAEVKTDIGKKRHYYSGRR